MYIFTRTSKSPLNNLLAKALAAFDRRRIADSICHEVGLLERHRPRLLKHMQGLKSEMQVVLPSPFLTSLLFLLLPFRSRHPPIAARGSAGSAHTNLHLFEYLMLLTDRLSHNIISHKRDIPMNQSTKQSANIEFKLCPPSLSTSSFARSNSSVETQKMFLGPAARSNQCTVINGPAI